MLLSYEDLIKLEQQGVIRNSRPELVNASSIDVRLGKDILFERRPVNGYHKPISLRDRDPLNFERYTMQPDGYFLAPGEFILANTMETFHLPPHVSAEYKLKSSMARMGLEHLNAGWCDAGWNGSVLTLELKNMTRHHIINIRPGDRIGQLVFFFHAAVPEQASYATKGSYNNDKTVTATKTAKPLDVRERIIP